jgi:hypothetical protein
MADPGGVLGDPPHRAADGVDSREGGGVADRLGFPPPSADACGYMV